MTSSPIADLSYRNYDGPLEPPVYRWWAIARVGVLRAFGNKWFWVLSVMGGFWYLILMIIFYFVDSFASTMAQRRPGGILPMDPGEASAQMFRTVHWNELFVNGFSMGQLSFFIIALLIGVGTIANDNRANALLVYLSKPCTKVDYIVGKWIGIFIPMAIAVAAPMLFFFGYCFMSYRSYGFLSDPWMIFKVLLLAIIPAAFHASLALGISSLFKQGRVAGASYAGVYFLTLFFTKAMGVVHLALMENGSAPTLVDNLFYFSVDGIQIGLCKVIFGTSGGNVFPFATGGMDMAHFAIPPPNGLLMTFAFFALAGISVLVAVSRVKAVEVVA